MPVYEPKREEEVLRNIQGTMPADATLRGIFRRIIDEMRTLQHMRMDPTRDGGANRHSCLRVFIKHRTARGGMPVPG